MYQKTEGSFASSNGVNTIKYYIYKPEGEIRAMIQLVHGMCEYVERYEPYIEFLTGRGFLVYGDDHLGHKGSISGPQDLGFFAKKDGWICLVKDEYRLTKIMKEAYPDLPLFLYGHSMGSFISRAYITSHADEIKGVILSGTAGSNSALSMGMKLAGFVKRLRGEKSQSALLSMMMFGSYNKRYKDAKSAYAWLTRDEKVVEAYEADPYCGFTFSTSGYLDLMKLLEFVTADDWYGKIPAELPIYVVSGSMDPVGGWGDGINEVSAKLKQTERADCTVKLYKDMRHEIHNEIGKEVVWNDIAGWIADRV
jgi:alpha-beta hydrolase superfamily lysophospholipase